MQSSFWTNNFIHFQYPSKLFLFGIFTILSALAYKVSTMTPPISPDNLWLIQSDHLRDIYLATTTRAWTTTCRAQRILVDLYRSQGRPDEYPTSPSSKVWSSRTYWPHRSVFLRCNICRANLQPTNKFHESARLWKFHFTPDGNFWDEGKRCTQPKATVPQSHFLTN